MEKFFESIKIRKLILVYVGIIFFLCAISEVPIIKSSKLLNEDLVVLLCNLGVIVWFMIELIKSHINIKEQIINLKGNLKSKDIVLSILINIIFTAGIFVTVVYTLFYISPSFMNKMLNEGSQTGTSTLYSIIINAIGMAVIGPIAEEFMFRGVILNRLRIKIGVKKAIIISSILFGMIHYELGMVSAVVFGIIMCLIYLKTKNIFVTSSIHIINNFIVAVAQVISFFVSNGAGTQTNTITTFNLYWLILGIVCLIGGVIISGYFIKSILREIRTKNETVI